MSDLNLEIGLSANAAPLNSAMQASAQSVQQFGKTAEAAGKGAAAASAEGSASTRAMADAFSRATASSGASSKKLQADMSSIGLTARQTANAVRMVPVQMTDAFVQLQGGGNPLTVLLQQGAQVKDSFGGLGPMFRYVASTITPVTVALGGLGLAAGVVGFAYARGSAEADAYNRALVISGNAAGTSRTQLTGMARDIGAVVGTQGQAADALAQLAATGQVATQNLQLVATVAVKMQRELGLAVKDTVADFAALGGQPLAASVKLNQQYNYLTIAVYEQIKALEKKGKLDQAAELAQRTFAEAMNGRTEEMKANLGAIERAWRSVSDTAAKAWDSILGIGRKADPAKELEGAKKALEAFENPNRKSQDPLGDEKRKAALRQRISDLTQEVYLSGEAAAADKSRADAVKVHIATEDERSKAAKASGEAYKKLHEDIQQRLSQARAEIVNGGELNEVQRFHLDMQQKLAEAAKDLSPAQQAQLRAYMATAEAVMRTVAAQRELADTNRANYEASRAAGQAALKEAEGHEKSVQQLRDEIAALGLTGVALAELEQARVGEQIAAKEAELDRFKGLDTMSLEEQGIRATIEALREKQRLLGAKAAVQEDQAVGAAMRKARDQEEQDNARRSEALADSVSVGILEGTRRGGDLMEVFRRELEAQFAKTILRPMVQPFVEQGNKLLGGLMEAAGNFLGLGGGSYNGSAGINGGSTILPSVLRGGADTGTNLVQRDMVTLLHKGEAVVPKAYNPAAGGAMASSAVNITVVNQTGQAASASATRKSDGSIEVLLRAVEEGIAGNVAAGTGPMASALHSRYGLRASFGT